MNRGQLRQIIQQAIEEEIESYEFYEAASKKVEEESIKKLFDDLAKEELDHKKFLEDFLDSKVQTMELKEVDDYKVAETIDRPRLTTEMDFIDGLKLAIKREEEAMEMYRGLASACEDVQTRDIFLGLSRMEALHKTRLEDIFVTVGYREVW